MEQYEKYLNRNNVNIKNLTFDYYNLLPKNGFLKVDFPTLLFF